MDTSAITFDIKMRTVWWVFTSKDVFCSEMKSRERPKLQGLFVQPSIRAVTVECLSLVTLVFSNDFLMLVISSIDVYGLVSSLKTETFEQNQLKMKLG